MCDVSNFDNRRRETPCYNARYREPRSNPDIHSEFVEHLIREAFFNPPHNDKIIHLAAGLGIGCRAGTGYQDCCYQVRERPQGQSTPF